MPATTTSTRIKICGLTRETDARTAIDLGADALGFVFYAPSKRAISAEQLPWLRQLPPFVQLTALFVNPTAAEVQTLLARLPIELLQFHGHESPEFCRQFGRRYLKAVPMQDLSATGACDYMAQHRQATGFLLDNYGSSEMGGSGSAFDWGKIPAHCPAPLIMAGGLSRENVAKVIGSIRPYGVDVSSGVESAPGIKSAEKMAAFIAAVRYADRHKKAPKIRG